MKQGRIVADDLVHLVGWGEHPGRLSYKEKHVAVEVAASHSHIGLNVCIFRPRFGLKLGFNCARLTENVDESVRQQVAKFVGCVALVDGAGSRLHVAEDHGVVVHLAAALLRCVYDQRGDQNVHI